MALATLTFQSCDEELDIHTPGNLVPPTVNEDSSLPSIKVNNVQLHAEAFGNPNDPMVVVLHGGPGADYRYLINCKALANDGYRVVFYDQRGAGLSQRFPGTTYTMQLLYDDLDAVIAHYRSSPDQKVFLLGHSWGAMLATAYINQNLDAVAGAILCEPGGFKWGDVEDYIERSRDFKYLSEALNDAVFSDQFITGKDDDHAVLDYKFDLWAAADETTDSPTGNEGKLPHWRSGAVTFDAYIRLAERTRPDWTTHLSQYTTKVLFVYSENNKAYGIAHAQKVSSAYPNADLFETLDAGHDMLTFQTGWNNTYPAIRNYLGNLK